MQFQQTITLHPANTVTVVDALARYVANVQTWLSFAKEPQEFSPQEMFAISDAWNAGRRTDVCAALIRCDRSFARIVAGG